MNAQRTCHFSLENKYSIIFVGHNSSEMISIDSREYSALRPIGYERIEFGACKLGNKLLVSGGKEMEQHVTNKCEVYNLESDTWTQVANMNEKRCKTAMIVYHGQIWVIGKFMILVKHKIVKFKPKLAQFVF